MDRGDIIRDLQSVRDMYMNIWAKYAERVRTEDTHLRCMRDIFEMHVRSLNYAITALKTEDDNDTV